MVHGYITLRKKSGSDGPDFPVKKSVKIGRGTHCDVRIHVQSVSEQHCLILVDKEKRAIIHNLSSNSHTFVNGIPVGKSGHALQHGDTIAVGERNFRWHYGPQTPFFEGKKGSMSKRRKSEADSAIGSHNVAVVNPLYHKRRTLGPTINYSDVTKRSPKITSDLKPHSAKKSNAERGSGVKTPGKNTPAAVTGTPVTKSSPVTTPRQKSSAKRASIAMTHVFKPLNALNMLPVTPMSDPPSVKTPSKMSSATKTSAKKSSIALPSANAPELKMSSIDSSTFYTCTRSDVKTATAKSPVVKTPSRKSMSKTPAKTPASKRKTKSAAKISKSQKRRLSSPPPVSAKRIKIESPKSIDKKKMAVLMGIHGKSSTLSTVKVVLSTRKTPVVKAIKTPHPSTKKGTLQHPTPGSKLKSSMKKPRRPLFSEILKKKAVQKANSVARKLALVPQVPPKAAKRNLKKMTEMCTEIPKTFKFGSTNHANSPETIFIGRKLAKTPVVTKKGRKDKLIAIHQKETINLSGVSEMFTTPVKATPIKSTSNTSPLMDRSRTPSSVTKRGSRSSSGASETSTPGSQMVQGKLLSPKSSPVKNITPVQSTSPMKPSSRLKSLNRTLSGSGSRKPRSLMTSTPAVRRKRESPAESVFESPSSLLGGQMSAPQSPASGRKSRLELVAPKTSYVHSPHASPGKSSLKSSPSKSPPSDGVSKNLSVSFNNSIRIKTLVPGSRRSLNTTAPLRSPAFIVGEDDSGTATPDVTTFDFNSVKTPNVPKEMFVSSILSSGGSSNGQASGSARRKGKMVRTPQNDLSNLHGIRRLMKTPASPAGYVDIKGVKRLMTNMSKTPTYLAVEGVKKLFGDAAAAAGNELSNFVGVRELFSSPSPQTKRESLEKATSRSSARNPSPVAKIQAEVESKGRTSPRSPRTRRSSSPLISASSKVAKLTTGSSFGTPVGSASRVTRKTAKTSPKSKIISPQPGSSKIISGGRGQSRKGRSVQEVVSVDNTPRKSPVEKLTVSQQGRNHSTSSASESSTVQSSPKKRSRKAAKVVSPVTKSPVDESTKIKTRRGMKKSTAQGAASSLQKRSSKKEIDDLTETSHKKEETVMKPSPKVTTKRTTARKMTAKDSPPVKSPPPKRTTRRGAKALTELESSPKTKSTKRERSPLNIDSPAKRPKQAKAEPLSPVNSPPKRATRRTRKGISPKKEDTPNRTTTTTAMKKKVVSFNEEVVAPAKKRKTASVKKGRSSSPTDKVSPEKSTRSKRGGSKKNQTHVKEESPNRKEKTSTKTLSPKVSPRRTRSRK